MKKRVLIGAIAASVALTAGWTIRRSDGFAALGGAAAPERAERFLEQVELAGAASGVRHAVAPATPEETRRSAFAALKEAFGARDAAAAGPAIEAYFEAGPGAVDALLARLGDPATGQADAEVAGILLQAAMLYAKQGSPLVAPWTPEELASSAIALLDAGPFAARVLQVGLKGFGPDLPPRCLEELLSVARGEHLIHTDFAAQFSALDLIAEWTRTMGPEVEPLLYELAADPTRGHLTRGDAVTGLLRRDWRAFGPELARLLRGQRDSMSETVRQQFEVTLAGTGLDLPPAERVALLRTVDDEAVTRSALENLSPEDARQIVGSASAEDRAWSGFDWVVFRAGSEGWVDAGLELLRRHEGDANRFVADSILQGLIAGAPNDPVVRDVLERRFEERATVRDPFWKALAFNLEQLPKSVLRQDVRSWLQRTRGEDHPSRLLVLDKLRSVAPDAAQGLL